VNYEEFLASKSRAVANAGIAPLPIRNCLFPYQRAIVERALKQGRFACFADTGLGKALMELEWARQISESTGGKVLILAPLAVTRQIVKEADKFDYAITIAADGSEVSDGITVTNYEKLHKFNANKDFIGIVLDESSVLKGWGTETRKALTEFARYIPYRFCGTATPAPNDLIEISNHAEFLGILTDKEIIALYFTQDGNTTQNWRLKGHAKKPFYRWLASWSCAVRKPSDIGEFDDSAHALPPLNYHHHTVEPSIENLSTLFAMQASTLREVRQAKRDSLTDRVTKCAQIVNDSDEFWIVWCELNIESEALKKAIPDSVELKGSRSDKEKESILERFSAGEIRVLITKPSIAGFGLNWQHCHNMAFVGLSYSFEQQYQAIRRCWRFGQEKPVNVHYVTSVQEGNIVAAVKHKEKEYNTMMQSLIVEMKDFQIEQSLIYSEARNDLVQGDNYSLYLGDCCERVKEIEDESVGLIIYSPPFPLMYAYSDMEQDMGNVGSIQKMVDHHKFLIPELMRVLKPGRMCCVHLCQITAMKSREGYIGLKDYRGEIIKSFDELGFPYAGEVTIEKNPQIQAIRNKERGLLFKSLATDAAMMRMALADYVLYFRKPGENPEPIKAGISAKYNPCGGWITEEEWIEWASPVWYRHRAEFPGGIRETNVLNVRSARESDDERHLCPLQTGVIERLVKLYSNPGDIVLDPFNGIGSTGVKSLELERKYVGIELKESYWKTARKNLDQAEMNKSTQLDLFALA
jgi:DNA modification methylase